MKTQITLTDGRIITTDTNQIGQVNVQDLMTQLNCEAEDVCRLLDALPCDVHYGYVHHGYAHKEYSSPLYQTETAVKGAITRHLKNI